ncbi:MAG TPA: M1 family metallopeptidase [Rhodanobacteraceae bacterium]|nr:M1 family metallopeptidase [Rhodanobacteraceae bacterium]
MRRIIHLFLIVVLATCCGAVFAAGGEAPPLEKLPRWAVPQAYSLSLRIDPAQKGYSGITVIKLDLKQASDHVWLHGKDLKVSKVTITDAAGSKHTGKYVDVAPDAGVVRVDFGTTLKPQALTMTLDFTAPYNQRLEGLYKVVHAGEPYAMTQMEPISARFAFPCFDEPDFKTPYAISLTIPKDDVGVANSKLVETTPEGDWKTLTFAQTKPLPTYLVAFAVGPWSVNKGPTIAADSYRKQPLPLRGIAAKDQAKHMDYILGETPKIIHVLESYYGFGYPFGKLDLLAAPDFSAGAMENAGLVTFRDFYLLLKPDSARRYVRGAFNVTAHELAHMWTGDTVTLNWWNDIWLNEAFATWMQQKVTEQVHPEYRADLSRVEGAEGAMHSDSLISARKIRQPITGNGDIQTAFDGITYQKGAAVIGMFEGFVGEKTFQKGMQAYIRKHKFGNAVASDLVGAIASAAGKGTEFKQAFNSFLDQSGVPEVSAELDCSGAQPVLHLSQSRYLPLGSKGDPDRTWGIPVCVRTGAGAGNVQCEMLSSAKGSMTLEGQCPAWYMPNADARGYYRFSMKPDDMAKLNAAVHSLSDAEQLAYADAVDASFHRGEINAAEALAILPELASSKTSDVALAPLDTFGWVWHHEARTDAQRARLTALVKKAYLPRLEKLGYHRQKGEPADAAEMRSALARVLGLTVKLPEVRAALLKQGDAVLKANPDGSLNFDAADSDLLGTVLAAEVQEHGKPVIDTLMKQLQTATNPAQRNAMLAALGQAKGAQAERVRDFAIGKYVKVGEMGRLLRVDRESKASRTAGWKWFVENYDHVLARTGTFGTGYLPMMGSGCSVAEAERDSAFFTPKLKSLPGADRGLAQATESTRLCAALKEAQDPAAILKL